MWKRGQSPFPHFCSELPVSPAVVPLGVAPGKQVHACIHLKHLGGGLNVLPLNSHCLHILGRLRLFNHYCLTVADVEAAGFGYGIQLTAVYVIPHIIRPIRSVVNQGHIRGPVMESG